MKNILFAHSFLVLFGQSLGFVPCVHRPTTCSSSGLTKNVDVDDGVGGRPTTPSLGALPSQGSEAPRIIDRRKCIEASLSSAISVLTLPQVAAADDDAGDTTTTKDESSTTNMMNSSRRPFAPIDTLVPATRVRLMIDDALRITNRLNQADVDNKRQLLTRLDALLLQPQNFTRGYQPIDVPKQPAQSYLDSYAHYRNSVSLLEKPGALLVQNGEIDTWKRLKRQEKAREDADEVRAALNLYTSNLNFNPDRYTLTGSKSERSRLIRNDQLPDVKNVIASDMGLRYLLRNEVLTALDDARAELRYQMEEDEKGHTVDGTELVDILQRAKVSCDKWFGLIGEEDVAAALEIVQKEKRFDSSSRIK